MKYAEYSSIEEYEYSVYCTSAKTAIQPLSHIAVADHCLVLLHVTYIVQLTVIAVYNILHSMFFKLVINFFMPTFSSYAPDHMVVHQAFVDLQNVCTLMIMWIKSWQWWTFNSLGPVTTKVVLCCNTWFSAVAYLTFTSKNTGKTGHFPSPFF